MSAHLVLVHDPAFKFLVVAVMTISVLDNIVDREVFQTSILGEYFAVSGFADARCTSHNDVGLIS